MHVCRISFPAAFQTGLWELHENQHSLPVMNGSYLLAGFSKVVEAADVILEVIDARDPEGGRCRDVERFVRKLDPKKKVILLLNKIGVWRGISGGG